MEYQILKHNDEEFFCEFFRDTFRSRILFNFTPDENFRGLAVGCNYSFKGHPIGFLKDNGLIISQVNKNNQRCIMNIEECAIQAGPTLVEDYEKFTKFIAEKFSTNDIVSGFHVHIGKKRLGNYIIGYTNKSTMSQISEKYISYNVLDAIKLPGLKKGSFYWKSSKQEIKLGKFPIPVALTFEPRLDEFTDFQGEIF